MASVCREAGATFKTEVRLRDLNVQVSATDERRVDVLADHLPCRQGKQLAIDVTLRSPVTTLGEPRARAAVEDGAAAFDARADKEAKYAELVRARRCELIVVALETGGRWSAEAADFVRELAFAKARGVSRLLRFSTALAWERRWVRMLSTASAVAFARSLTAPKGAVGGAAFSPTPFLSHLLASGSDGGDRGLCLDACPGCSAEAPATSFSFGWGVSGAVGLGRPAARGGLCCPVVRASSPGGVSLARCGLAHAAG